MAHWEIKPLGEICLIKPPKSEASAKLTGNDEVSFVPMEDLGIGVKHLQASRIRTLAEVGGSYTYFADGDVLLAKITPCFENGKLGIARNLKNGVGFGSSEYIVLRPGPALDAEFLYYYLARPAFLEAGAKSMAGAVGHKRVTKEFIENYPIPIPPLDGQRRIVALLDEAFEGIATAKANAEKNLQNANELFASYVRSVFALGAPSWQTKTLDQLSINLDSKRVPITKSDRQAGEYPYYGASGIVDYVADFIFDGDALLISEDGANLLARSTPIAFPATGRYWVNNHAHILRFDSLATQRFVEFFLESIPLDEYITGAAQPKLNQKALNSIPITIPNSVDEQARVVEELAKMSQHCELLRESQQRKLAALDELKTSLLDQAFSGQLLPSEMVRPSLVSACPTTSPEFSATIISLAYERHRREQQEKTFGHVKEQKLLHLVEAIAKVDLGREPMKDAAGPNDFQHQLNAESWAREQGHFDVARRDGGYEFKRLTGFEALLARTNQVLGAKKAAIEAVIDLVVPLDTRQAEVLATVHAAWNNLLRDGADSTDTAAIQHALKDWHPRKKVIQSEEVHWAMAFIRANGLVPDGTAKYVVSQPSLPF